MNTLRQLFGRDVLRDFWHWFSKHKDRFYRFEQNEAQLFSALTKKLKQIHPSLTFEFSAVHPDGTRELTISADGIRDAFPFVVQLVDRCPKIENWTINAFRQRIPADDLTVQIGENVKVGFHDIFFSHRVNEGLIDLDVRIRNYEDTDAYKSALFILLDALLGEYDVEMKVGRIDFSRLSGDPSSDLQPIVCLRALVDSVNRA